MATFRFSALPRIAVCPASWITSQGMPSVSDADAQRGTEKHREIAQAVNAESHPVWDRLREIAPGKWLSEHPLRLALGEHEVVGTSDAVNAPRAVLADFKDSHGKSTNPRESLQIVGYSVARADESFASEATIILYHLPTNAPYVHALNADDLRAARERIHEVVEEAVKQEREPIERRKYAVGDGCTYCPGRVQCPALASQRKEALAVLGESRLDLPRERFPWFVEQANGVIKALEAAKSMIRNEVEFSGPIEADGRRLYLASRMMPAAKSWNAIKPLLIEMGHAEIAEQVEAALDARPKVEQFALTLGKAKGE